MATVVRSGELLFMTANSAAEKSNFRMPGVSSRFSLILPQDKLESTLEQALRNKGICVQWNHRFDVVQEEIDSVEVTVEELGGTSVGYIVPHWETIVKRRWPVRIRFLIGADGHNSLVRQRLGIDYERVSGPEFFAAYEFESDDHGEDEVRVVLDETTTNVLWPLPQNRFRWTFQLLHSEIAAEFPDKERRAVRVAQQNVDERIRHYVQKVAKHRAPWFSAKVNEIAWCTEVSFEHRLAERFRPEPLLACGRCRPPDRPGRRASMNSGFAEVEVLAAALKQVLPGNTPMSVLDDYSQSSEHLWRRLLGLTGGLKPRQETDPWMKQRHAGCFPACRGLTGTWKLWPNNWNWTSRRHGKSPALSEDWDRLRKGSRFGRIPGCQARGPIV